MRTFAIGLLLSACWPFPEPIAPNDVRSSCEQACVRLSELKCPEAEPTADGVSCVDLCIEVESAGTVSLNPACVSKIARCDDMEVCE